MRKPYFVAAVLILAMLAGAGCGGKPSTDVPATGAAASPAPTASSGPVNPAPAAADAFPADGLRSIFRNDFPFVCRDGEVDPVSVPPARPGCGARLLNDGPERLEWRLKLIAQARESIRLQTFIFTADGAGDQVADALKSARRQGRLIKLTVDCYTKFKPADRLLYNGLELAGIKVMGLEPVHLTGITEHNRVSVNDVNMRFHEKYFVVDEQAAIVGGTNVADEYYRFGEDPASRWRDQDVLLVGPIVHDVARAFDDNYEYFKLRRDGRLPTNRAAWFKKAWWMVAGTPPPVDTAPEPGRLELGADLDADNVTARFLRHRPRRHEDYIFQAYLHLIDHADKSIIIENAYFVPNRALLNALMRAARRGVKVMVITNSAETNDVPNMQPLTRYSYFGLIENGAAVYEWQGDHPGKGCLHVKAAVFDGQVTVIGSCNLDPRSLGINSEDVVLIDSPVVAQKLTRWIETVDLPNSKRIDAAQARAWHDPGEIDDTFRLLFGKAMEDWI